MGVDEGVEVGVYWFINIVVFGDLWFWGWESDLLRLRGWAGSNGRLLWLGNRFSVGSWG